MILPTKPKHAAAVFAKRFQRTARGLKASLFAPPLPGAPPAWTGSMTIVALLAWVGVVLIHPFDAAVIHLVAFSKAWPLVFLRDATNIGRSTRYLVGTFVVALALSLMDWKGAGRRLRGRLALLYGQAMFAFTAIALSGLTTDVVKIFVGRARPKFLDVYGPNYVEPFHVGYDFASFPSGHATTMGAIAAVLALWFPRWRWPLGAVSLVFAFSRSVADAHYPSDVWAGFVFGFLFTVFMARLLARRAAGFRFVDGRVLPALRFARPSKGQNGSGSQTSTKAVTNRL